MCWCNFEGCKTKAEEFYGIPLEGKSVADLNKESAFLQDSSNGCEQMKGPISIESAPVCCPGSDILWFSFVPQRNVKQNRKSKERTP